MKTIPFLIPLFGVALVLHGQELPKREFRGAWIATVSNLDWPSDPLLTTETKKQQLVTRLEALHAAGINVVVFQVRPECDALYASPLEPWSYWLTGQQGQAPLPFFDPLEFAIEETHKRGMELHAWFNPYRSVRSIGSYTPAPNHVSVLHPDWNLTIGTFKFLNPGLKEVREYITSVVLDVVDRYDVDGVHFDDYFYPYPPNHMTASSTNDALDDSAFAADSRGFSLKADWRRDNVNLMIKMVQDSIQSVKPHVKFGMSPFGIWKNGVPTGIVGLDAYSTIYCDAMAWLNQGSIDYLTPQLYWRIGGNQDYSKLMPWWADSVAADGKHLYTGNIFGSAYSTNELPNQLRLNRKNANVQGNIWFRALMIVNNDLGFRDSLTADLYRYPALIPRMPWKDNTDPNPPGNLRYEPLVAGGPPVLQWDVPPTAADGDSASRYVIYRLTTSSPQQSDMDDPQNILSVERSREFSPTVPLTDGPWYYVVSSLDRNHNESVATSPLLISAPAAPILVSPLDGAGGLPPNIDLTWNSEPMAAGYDLEVSSDSTFSSNVLVTLKGIVDTSKTTTGFAGQQQYFWRVAASNAGGTSSFSSAWKFTTGFPATPLLASPANISVDIPINPTFTWYQSQAADTYRLQLSLSTDFIAIVKDTAGLTDTSMTVTGLEGNKIYFWRISATNSFGVSLWSETWRFRTESPSNVLAEHVNPAGFELAQNYPNPFNPDTRIPFSLSQESRALLAIYDILGREVAVLVDETLPPGYYSAVFHARSLPSGTYLAVLRAGEFRAVRKLLLLR